MISLLEKQKREKGVFNYIGILDAVNCIAQIQGDTVENIAEWLLTIHAHELNFYKISKLNDVVEYGEHPHGIAGVSYSDELLTAIKNEQISTIEASEYLRPYWHIEDLLNLINLGDDIQKQITDAFEQANKNTHIRKKPLLTNDIDHLKDQVFNLQQEIKQLEKQLEVFTEESNSNNRQTRGLDEINSRRTDLRKVAVAIANYLWGLDEQHLIRTGDMVQQVKSILYTADISKVPKDDTVRDWLSKVAPAYAKVQGRKSKDTPDKITLIMEI